MFGVEQARAGKDEPLRIAVSVGIDVAPDTVENRVVARNRAIQIETQNLPLIGAPVRRLYLRQRREILCAIPIAVVREEVAPLIAAADIQLSVGPEHDPPAAVVSAVRQAGEHVEWVREMLRLRLVRVPSNLHATVHAASRIAVVRVGDVDVVRSFALEQIRMQRHAEEAILRERLIHLVNRDRHRFRAIDRIDTRDALAHSLGDPQESIGTPRDFPRAVEIGRHDPRDERLRPEGRDDARVLCGNALLRAEHGHRPNQRDDE